jgi:phosphopantetheine--protein transferase-like protein
MVMENEIKKIYNTLSGGKIISSDNHIISSSHFNSISFDRFTSELIKIGINWDGNDIYFANLMNKKVEYSNDSSKLNLSNSNNEINTSLTILSSDKVGIDIQEISELPDSNDFWEDEFYKSKFTSEEIAFCITKDNAKQSFAGLYSCKEALIKSNNNLKWENINIIHNIHGKPIFPNYDISISHSGLYSIAIAIRVDFQIKTDRSSDTSNNILDNLNINDLEKLKIDSKNISYLVFYTLVILILSYLIFRDFLKL